MAKVMNPPDRNQGEPYVDYRRRVDGFQVHPTSRSQDGIDARVSCQRFLTNVKEIRSYQIERWGLEHPEESRETMIHASTVFSARAVGSRAQDHLWPWDSPLPELPTNEEESHKLLCDAAALLAALDLRIMGGKK